MWQGFELKLTPMSFCFTPTHLGSLSFGESLNLTRVQYKSSMAIISPELAAAFNDETKRMFEKFLMYK